MKRTAPIRRNRHGSRFKNYKPLPDYRAFILSRPCTIRGCTIRGPMARITVAHVKTRGAGGQDKGNIIPLCLAHHQYQHTIGIKSFQEEYHIDLYARAERWADCFDDGFEFLESA